MESQGSVSRAHKVATLAVRFRGDWWPAVKVTNQSYPAAQLGESWGHWYPNLSSSVFSSPTETPIGCAQTVESKEAYPLTDGTREGEREENCHCWLYFKELSLPTGTVRNRGPPLQEGKQTVDNNVEIIVFPTHQTPCSTPHTHTSEPGIQRQRHIWVQTEKRGGGTEVHGKAHSSLGTTVCFLGGKN